MISDRCVTYDRRHWLAKFSGPGGFTQQHMPEGYARAIAEALRLPFEVVE